MTCTERLVYAGRAFRCERRDRHRRHYAVPLSWLKGGDGIMFGLSATTARKLSAPPMKGMEDE